MSSEVFADWCKETVASAPGTGVITLGGSPSAEFPEFSDVVPDTSLVPYEVIDGDDREQGLGTYALGANTLTRTTVLATWVGGVYDDTAPTALTLTADAIVFIAMSSFQAMSKTNTTFTNAMYRSTATLNGTAIDNHVNLGGGTSITGTAGQAYDFCGVLSGEGNTASNAHAVVGGGKNNVARGTAQNVLCGGYDNDTTAFNSALVGGYQNLSSGQSSFVGGGQNCDATAAQAAVGGGLSCIASATGATISGGRYLTASGVDSAVLGGYGNKANHIGSIAGGGGSLTRANYDLVLGATATIAPAVANNTIRLQAAGGNIKIDGAVTSPEADYAEMFEWFDQNSSREDRVGYFVSLHRGQIVKGAGRDDKSNVSNYLASLFTSPNSATNVPMIGVISGTPSVIGDAAPNNWAGRHKKDKFKRVKKNSFEMYEWEESVLTPDGDELTLNLTGYKDTKNGKIYDEYPQYTHKGLIRSSGLPKDARLLGTVEFPEVVAGYDPNTPYIPRIERQEWDAVGMLGKLIVHSAEPITSDWVRSSVGGKALNAANGVGYQVLEIIDNYTVRILFK